MGLLKRLLAWFTGEQESRPSGETPPADAAPVVEETPPPEEDESPASPSSASPPSRAFSIWTESETLTVNPVSKTLGE